MSLIWTPSADRRGTGRPGRCTERSSPWLLTNITSPRPPWRRCEPPKPFTLHCTALHCRRLRPATPSLPESVSPSSSSVYATANPQSQSTPRSSAARAEGEVRILKGCPAHGPLSRCRVLQPASLPSRRLIRLSGCSPTCPSGPVSLWHSVSDTLVQDRPLVLVLLYTQFSHDHGWVYLLSVILPL